MHIWPSTRIRDSFKAAYLKNLEWNLHRMNSEKKPQSESSTSIDNNQKLLYDDTDENATSLFVKVLSICKELLLILSCCYCCFCCGVCVDDEES